MENIDSERKQKLKKVAKLGVKCAWLVIDWFDLRSNGSNRHSHILGIYIRNKHACGS